MYDYPPFLKTEAFYRQFSCTHIDIGIQRKTHHDKINTFIAPFFNLKYHQNT